MALGDIINTSTLNGTFDGEFNSFISSPDGSTGLWRTSLKDGARTLSGNGEQEYYSDSSVGVNPFSISNGVLDIQATPGSNALNLPYNSGVITTENSFNQLYGYFEIDAKLPTGQGLWPAFWLVPASGAWPPELDTLEVLGNNASTLYFSTHSAVQATQTTALTVSNTSTGFNLYGVMWGPKTVDLYINNVEVASMPTPADMNVPMYMLANLAVGGYWPGNPNSSTVFPANMLINYVKAFAYPGTAGGTVYDTTPAQNIGPAPLAPVMSAPATLPATSGVATLVGNVTVNSNWPGGFFTIVVSDNSGLLQTSATADVFTSGEGTNYVTLTGNLAPINAALATLTYQGASAGSEWVWVSATNPQGIQSSTHVTVTTTTGTGIPVVASAPALITLATMSVAADTLQAIRGISITDGQTTGTFSFTISDGTGLLNAAAASGVTLLGAGSTSLTLTGSLAAINADLATLTYQAGTSPGTDWVWVSTNDPNGQQALANTVVTVTSPESPTVPVLPPPPVLNTQSAMAATSGTTQTISGISISDSQTTGTFSFTISDGTGLLNAGAASGGTMLGAGSTNLTLTGSLAAINADLSSLTYQAGASAGTDWVWVSANDPNGQQVLNHTVVTVTAPVLPTLPMLTAPSAMTVTSGTTQAITGIGITDSQSTGTLSFTISDGTGLLGAAAASGLTVVGAGSTSLTLTGSLTAINADLSSLTYQAGASAGTDWVWVSANYQNGQQALNHTMVTVTAPVLLPLPVLTAPTAMTVTFGVTQAVTGISITDSQTAGTFSFTISDNAGLLNAATASGLTLLGAGSTSLTLTGSLTAINADLSSLTYQAGASAGTDWLWVSANDPNGQQVLDHTVVTVMAPATGNTALSKASSSGIILSPAAASVAVPTATALPSSAIVISAIAVTPTVTINPIAGSSALQMNFLHPVTSVAKGTIVPFGGQEPSSSSTPSVFKTSFTSDLKVGDASLYGAAISSSIAVPPLHYGSGWSDLLHQSPQHPVLAALRKY